MGDAIGDAIAGRLVAVDGGELAPLRFADERQAFGPFIRSPVQVSEDPCVRPTDAGRPPKRGKRSPT